MTFVLVRIAQTVLSLPAATVRRRVRALHTNETGAEEGMNKLLIFALIALPLLALLYAFGQEIIDFANESFDTATGGGPLAPGR
jgi:hypothetical protein